MKKIKLTRETLRTLSPAALTNVAGGRDTAYPDCISSVIVHPAPTAVCPPTR